MKLTGCIFVIFAFVLAGYKMAENKNLKIKELKNILILLTEIKSIISFSFATPKEIFLSVNYENSKFASSVAGSLIEGMSFKNSFNEALEKSTTLESDDKEILTSLTDFLGLFDRDTQVQRLELLISEIEKSIALKESSLKEKQKLDMILSVSLGLGIIIVLI